MAGRAAKYWVRGMTLVVACLADAGVRAVEPVQPPTALTVSIPPLPVVQGSEKGPDAPSASQPPQERVAFQRPPQPPAVLPPSDPFQEPPISPFLPPSPEAKATILPEGSRVNLPTSPRQLIRFSPRYGQYSTKRELQGPNQQRVIITGGVIVSVVYFESGVPREVEFATDNAVVWIRGKKTETQANEIEAGENADGKRTEVELYMSGNVVIRSLSGNNANTPIGGGPNDKTVQQIFRADEIYYEVNTSRAIALNGTIELKVPAIPDSIYFHGHEIWQLGKHEYRAFTVDTSSSKRPSDPAVKFKSREATLIERNTIRRNIFGMPFRDLRTGEYDYGFERVLTAERTKLTFFNVPVGYFGRTRTNLNDPVGPLAGLSLGNGNVFGTQVLATFNLFNLFALRPPDGHKWYLHTDYMAKRGFALGADYNYRGPSVFGFGGPHSGALSVYGLNDEGIDNLGSYRGVEPVQPDFRGRARWQHNQDLYENGTTYVRVLAQAAYLTDKNFYEQYYKYSYDTLPNQETFVQLPWASGTVGGSLLAQGNLERDWVTETEWFPRADGYLLGQSFLYDRLNYSARGDLGYAGLRPAEIEPFPILPTDQRIDTGRFHLNQKLSAPVDLGPLRLDPYGIVDLTHYTEDLTGESRGRFYGGGGAKASMSFSRLYPEVRSELFNLKGLHHKVNLNANYYASYSDTPYSQLPQLDRLNDDALDLDDRLYRPQQQSLTKGPAGSVLSHSPIYDPQRYAIRRLVDNKYDTLDTIQVLQLEARQRWQTKRGFAGNEHIVDWLSANTSVSFFPDAERDNFGENYAFLEGDVLWHVGDRTSLGAAGWYDPFVSGARYYNFSASFDRPDGNSYFVSYRHTDPVHSRLFTAGVNYQLSHRYLLRAITSYDVGVNESLTNQLNIARIGSDVTVMFGASYNSLQKNFSIQFSVVPNLFGLTPTQVAYGRGYGLSQSRQ